MDCVYTIDINPNAKDDELIISSDCICSLSSKNILAMAIKKSIYVIPLEKPNEIIEVFEANSDCDHLTWCDDALSLLSVHKNGFNYVHNFNVSSQIYVFSLLS